MEKLYTSYFLAHINGQLSTIQTLESDENFDPFWIWPITNEYDNAFEFIISSYIRYYRRNFSNVAVFYRDTLCRLLQTYKHTICTGDIKSFLCLKYWEGVMHTSISVLDIVSYTGDVFLFEQLLSIFGESLKNLIASQ